MINLRFTFVKIIVIQPSGCKGNFNKTIYLVYLKEKEGFEYNRVASVIQYWVENPRPLRYRHTQNGPLGVVWTTSRSTTGGPSSSCEMIILRNNGDGGRPLWGIKKIRQILNKNTSPYFHSVSFVIWPLTLKKITHFSELSISRFSTYIRKAQGWTFHFRTPDPRSFSYLGWKPRNGKLIKMGSFHQSK